MSPAALLVLAAGFLVLAVSMGTRFSFGMFLEPMSRDLGWSFSIFALAMGMQHFLWGLMQPFAGMLADRWGAGKVVAGGMLIYAAGVLWMANVDSPAELYLGSAVLIALGGSGAGLGVVLGAAARVAPADRRTLVMGIMTAGASFGQLVFSPLAQALIERFGWSGALTVMAATAGVSALLAVALAIGGRGAGQAQEPEFDQSLRQALTEATGHSGFLYLTAGFFVCGFHVALIMTHLPAYAVVCGLPAMAGATALSIIGLFNLIGTNVAGALGDRYRKKYLLSGIYASRSVVIALYLILPVTELSTQVFAAAIGLLWLSTVPLTSGLVSQIFGLRYFATLFGIVFFSHQVGAFLGAWLGGYLFDLTGSYDGVWLIAIALGLFAAVVHFPIADRPLVRPARAAA
ncbi:MAG: MFS transporter [Alphaproteobacteria bacterium]